jgi:hypothetical protein
MRMEGKPGLERRFEESSSGAGERRPALSELRCQKDSNVDVLLSSKIANAVVPDRARRKSMRRGAKCAQKLCFTFDRDYFCRTDERHMRRGRKLTGTTVRDVCHALAFAGGKGSVEVVAHSAIIGRVA